MTLNALHNGGKETASHLQWLQDNNITLLKEENRAVGMMQLQLEQLIKTLLTRQLIGIAFGIFSMIFAGLTIMKVLNQLLEPMKFSGKKSTPHPDCLQQKISVQKNKIEHMGSLRHKLFF